MTSPSLETPVHEPPLSSVPRKATPRVLSRKRRGLAFAIAASSDLIQLIFSPAFAEGAASPFDLALDAVTAVLILLVVGFQWRLALALAAELVPGVDLFPTWTAVVLSLPAKRGE
jgi:hypothetical protein